MQDAVPPLHGTVELGKWINKQLNIYLSNPFPHLSSYLYRSTKHIVQIFMHSVLVNLLSTLKFHLFQFSVCVHM